VLPLYPSADSLTNISVVYRTLTNKSWNLASILSLDDLWQEWERNRMRFDLRRPTIKCWYKRWLRAYQ